MSQYVAPLNIWKGRTTATQNGSSEWMTSNARIPGFEGQIHMTPPLTPHSSREEMVQRSSQERLVFHNYLRAFYPFQPTGTVSSSTITLPLDQGDIILVHSVHINGWADGTLLDTGARGWLPTNYCEAYDQLFMRPLLKALIDFWDIIRVSSLQHFSNQDYMRGLIAGVRFLLEKSECLTRECPLVQRFDGLRRNRKALLSDLSSLVKIAKRLQDVANGAGLDDPLDIIFDQMLLKAFRIVTRGVRFLDVWNEEVGLSRAMADLGPRIDPNRGFYEPPLTPPVDASFPLAGPLPSSSASVSLGEESARSVVGLVRKDSSPSSTRLEFYMPSNRQSQHSIRAKRTSVSHRVSYGGSSSAVRSPNLASEQLGTAYDQFLGVLGSFIGLHLQSRSSTELILTTQQSVQSCRTLLSVVEAVWERDLHRSEYLEQAKDNMYEKITELAQAAGDAFRPANTTDEEIVFLPDEGKRLVSAATDCVRGAGDCVAKARHILEQIGDFEVEPVGLGISFESDNLDSSICGNEHVSGIERATAFHNDVNITGHHKESSVRLLPPPIRIPSDDAALSLTPALTDGTTPSSEYMTTMIQTPTPTLDEPMTPAICSLDVDETLVHPDDLNRVESRTQSSPVKGLADEMYAYGFQGDVTSSGSELTYMSNMRDSKISAISRASTRATSPEVADSYRPLSQNNSFERCDTALGEEVDESGEHLLEKTFAHELMLKDGQVIGGSLRALIERLTAHESTPDALFVSTFYLTFRHFAGPVEFAEALVDRYDYGGDNPRAAGPVRLRVYNVFKGWLESHWRHDCDDVALDCILKFATTKLIINIPTAGKRLVDLVEKVSTLHGPVVPRLVSSIGKTNTSMAQYVNPDAPLPTPIISKSQLNLLKQWKNGGAFVTILDFDPLELARQFTLKESRIFCSILPEELLSTEWMKKSGSLAVNVRAMSTLSTDLANLVADCVLQSEEPKKRAAIIKQWVKIANRCLELNNYDSLMAIICSLNSSTISRLKRTWELVSQKTKNSLEHLRQIVDVSRNYAVLRQRLQNHVPPCLPFVGTYLTDLTFVDHGNQDTRLLPTDSGSMHVINFDKHMKTAKIISELQRFQIPYRIAEVPELQTWMQDQLIRVRSAGERSFQNYYRRSLVLEPKAQRNPPVESNQSIFSREVAKDKFDFLAWTHSSKLKSVTSHG